MGSKIDLYTADDFVRDAQAKGYEDVSKRLVHDWSSSGLLDHPALCSPGRRGRPDAFPEAQRELFFLLLEQRKRRTKQIVGLCNVPVFIWLWWGEAYIPLRQARQALKTWAESCLSRSVVGAQRAAAHFLRQMNLPRYARGRKALKLALEELIIGISRGHHPDSIDWSEVESRLRRVWGTDRGGKPRGPIGAQVTPEIAMTLFRDRYRAIVSLGDYNDTLFEWARWTYRRMSREYAVRNEAFARDPELGHLHLGAASPQHLVNHACLDLLTTLGSAYLVHREGTLWDPGTWQEYQLRSTTAGEVTTREGVIVPIRG